VIYKINRKKCAAPYVGQTGRLLKSRISEYRNHINRNTTQHSVNVKILAEEKFQIKDKF